MKVQKYYALLFFFLMAFCTYAQTVEKTLVKSIGIASANKVYVDLPGEVKIEQQHWDSNTIRVEMNISLKNFNESILKSLIAAGRYNVVSTSKNDGLYLHAPNKKKSVTIRGTQLNDNVVYLLKVPEEIQVEVISKEVSNTSAMNDSSM